MTKSVTVEELAENLRDYLAEAKDGTSFEIVADDEVIAILEPGIHYPTSNLRTGDIEPGPRPKNLRTNSLQILFEDRHGSGEDYE